MDCRFLHYVVQGDIWILLPRDNVVQGDIRILLPIDNVVWGDKWGRLHRDNGLRNLPEQKDVCHSICKMIEETFKYQNDSFAIRACILIEVPFKLYVLRLEHENWKQVEDQLRQFLLEYKSEERDVIVDWDDVRKPLMQIIVDLKREHGFQGITVEDLDGKQHIIYKRWPYRNNNDYLVDQVVEKTGISKEEFVLVYEESLISPGEYLEIPDGAKIKLLPLKKEQGIVVEDLDGQQHIIKTNWRMYTNDVDYLISKVADKTGISKTNFVLVYKDKLIIPGKHVHIPDGAKIQLLPVKKGQKHSTDLFTFVRGIFSGIYGQIDRLFTYFPKVFEDTTRLLSEKDFVRISKLIGKGWVDLGIELGLTNVKLQQIEEDKQNVVSRITEMLNKWGQTQEGGATAGQLLTAVRNSKVNCEFDKLKRVLLIGL